MTSRLTMRGARYVAQRFGLFAVFGALLFLSAGSWTWWRGWAYLIVTGAVEAVTLLLLAVRSPELLNIRGTHYGDLRPFDRIFAGLWLLLGLGASVVAGLDAVRFEWTSLPWDAFFVGLIILLFAASLGGWAMLENVHFEQFVRIQKDRGHRVVSTGPYAILRHPGYLAAIVGGLSTPLLLGSLWAFVPVGLGAILFVIRTALEDRTLSEELAGYSGYAERVRYRLVPPLW